SPDMGKRLREALESKPNYIVGLQPITLAFERWPQIQKEFPDIQWVDADSIHNASIDGRLEEMFRAICEEDVILVGPAHLKPLQYKYEYDFMEIPSVNCWQQYEYVVHSLMDRKKAIVLLCASMMSEVIIDEFRYSSMTFIDMGSVLDPYCGVKSRRYHHKLALGRAHV